MGEERKETKQRAVDWITILWISCSLYLAMVIVGYMWIKFYQNGDYSSTVQQLIMFTLTLEAIVIGIIVIFIPRDPVKKLNYVWKEKGGVYTRHILTTSLTLSIIFGVSAFCIVDLNANLRYVGIIVAIWGTNTFYMIFRSIEVIAEFMISDKI